MIAVVNLTVEGRGVGGEIILHGENGETFSEYRVLLEGVVVDRSLSWLGCLFFSVHIRSFILFCHIPLHSWFTLSAAFGDSITILTLINTLIKLNQIYTL